jgi:hypothetical protein
MQATVQLIKAVARKVTQDRNAARKKGRAELKLIVQFNSVAQVGKLLGSTLPIKQLLAMVKSQLRIYRDLLSHGKKVVVMSQEKEAVAKDGTKKTTKISGNELLPFLCAQLKQLISQNITDNGGFAPWQKILNADAAPGCEQYFEECEEPESDDDVLFAAAAAQQLQVCPAKRARVESNSDDDDGSDADFEKNDHLTQLGLTLTAAITKLKATWTAQLKQKQHDNQIEYRNRLARYNELQSLAFPQQLFELKRRWRIVRVSECPEFKEVESDMDSEEEYVHEATLKQRHHRNKVQYYVKWLGYSVGDSTWEKSANIASHPGVVRDWKQKQLAINKEKAPSKEAASKRKSFSDAAISAPINKRAKGRSSRSCASKYQR